MASPTPGLLLREPAGEPRIVPRFLGKFVAQLYVPIPVRRHSCQLAHGRIRDTIAINVQDTKLEGDGRWCLGVDSILVFTSVGTKSGQGSIRVVVVIVFLRFCDANVHFGNVTSLKKATKSIVLSGLFCTK